MWSLRPSLYVLDLDSKHCHSVDAQGNAGDLTWKRISVDKAIDTGQIKAQEAFRQLKF